MPVHGGYFHAPSLWLGANPMELVQGSYSESVAEFVRLLHVHLERICWTGDSFDWEGRRRLLQALRRAVLRESVLVRLLPEREEREGSGWGELLVSAFFAPMMGQSESMAHRMAVFRDLREPTSAR